VLNFPTFTLATGIAHGIDVGGWFATKSPAGSGRGASSTNETELFARWRAVGGVEGTDGLHIAVTPAYSLLARSLDGELGVDYTTGPLTVEGAARFASKPLGSSGGARAAFAGGAVARVNRYVALSADVGSFVSPSVQAAWSIGLQLGIPNSPHTFSFEVSNAAASTIQGNSIAGFQKLYGFEFTIPLHLSRFGAWFHSPKAAVSGDVGAAVGATVTIASIKFGTDTVTIMAGQAVRWNNGDPLAHTVTFEGPEQGSGEIPPNGAFVHRFAAAGTYTYHCTPHPFMKAVVVVR